MYKPTALHRPAPFWSWNDKLDEGELRRQIREMAAKGWGSYFMHSRVGLVTGYLSDEWMSLVNACADEAAKTHTYAWLYDEDKWPSGFAGGEVPRKDGSYRYRALELVKAGSETANDSVLSTCSHGGIDYSICKRVSALGSKWFNGACYVDLMNPEAVREFLNCTHERYKKACSEHFGKAIPGVFTDEPCYFLWNHHESPAVPWSDYLPDFFNKTKGYDILPKLAQLFFDIGDYRKVRLDFYDAASELFKQSFTKQYYDWCEANNLIMTGHFLLEDSLRYQTQCCGDVMSHYECMHWPGIDKLGRDIYQMVTSKQLSSVVDQLGKERAFSEVYGGMGGQASFLHRKWISDWQAALGISFINHHLSLYLMRGERKRDYPANLFYQQPWWEDEREFADYQGRLCAAVSEGQRLVDILVIQPLSSVRSEYSPLHKDSDYAPENAYDQPFADLSEMLMADKLDYHYGNETLMSKYGSVENGRLKVGKHAYSCVVVPPCSNLRSATVELLAHYCRAGGRLVFIGSVPTLIDGVDAEVAIPGAEVVPSLADALARIQGFFPNRVRVTDTLTHRNAPSVYVHSRMVGASTRHLFVNTDDEREVKAKVCLPDSASPVAAFDLFGGGLHKLNASDGCFDVELAPAGSLVVVCGEEARAADANVPAILGCGASFAPIGAGVPCVVISDFDCQVLEENVMVLNDFSLELDGREVYQGPVCGAWHEHFYPAPDRTGFKATYSFFSECELAGCFAAIEVAENLDSITFNGERVSALKTRSESGPFDPAKSWKDINFTRVPLPAIKPGINELAIEGKKVNNITMPGQHAPVENWRDYAPTEAEEVYICGNFTVRSISDSLKRLAAPSRPVGKNIVEESYPFYCGRMKMSAHFDLGQKPGGQAFLQLNGVDAACVRVSVNSKDCGTLRWKPYILEVSRALRAGGNLLELELAATLVNAFGPNRISDIKTRLGVSPVQFCDMSRFTTEYQLFRYGILGAALFKKVQK